MLKKIIGYKNTLLAVVAACCCCSVANAQELEWAKKWEPIPFLNYHNMVSDHKGNFYFRGNLQGTVDLDIDASTNNITSIGNSPNQFVSRYDALGMLQWAKSITSSPDNNQAEIRKMTTDIKGNLLFTGYFTQDGKVDFDPGTGTADTFYLNSPTMSAFISKLDTNGNLIWAKQTTNTIDDNSSGFSIATDSDENVYATGEFYMSATIDNVNLSPVNNNFPVNMYIAKFEGSTGALNWVKTIGGSDYANGRYVTVDNDKNIYLMGNFRDTLFLKSGNIATPLLTSPGAFNVFIVKLDSLGNFVWAKQMAGTYFLPKLDFQTDSANNLYVYGKFNTQAVIGTTTLTSNNFDVFISKWDPAGNVLWAKQMGAVLSDDEFVGATVNNSGVYVTGNFRDTATFGSLQLIPDLQYSGQDIFYTKLDDAGNFIWAKQIGGINDDYASAISVSNGKIYTFGSFIDSVDFDPSVNEYKLEGAPTYSHFISKMNLCTTTSDTLTETACNDYTLGGQVYTQSGTYTHTFLNAESCDSMITVHVTINTIDTSVTPSATTLAANETGASYQWINCSNGSSISGETNSFFTPTANGTYAVVITKNGCSDTSSCYNMTSVSVEGLTLNSDILVYPNPTKNYITLESHSSLQGVTITVSNMIGQSLLSFTNKEHKAKVDFSALVPGVYIVELQQGKSLAKVKIVKE